MQSRSGELAMRPLPAVLLDLHENVATGRLTLRRGKVSKNVDLVNGNPVSTTSTPRDETLGHFLVSTGVISEDQHRLGVQKAAEMGGKLGEVLVAMGVLTVENLIEQLGKQARHKLVQSLRWPQGAWRFEDGKQAASGMQLRMIEVVLGGLKETAVDDLGRLARLDGMAFELTERGQRLRHELKRWFGERALSVLDAGAPIVEIEKAIGDRVQARIALDSMLMCDAIVSKTVQVGLGTTPISRIKLPSIGTKRKKTEPELDAVEPTPLPPPMPEGEEGEELFALLFDEELVDDHKPTDGQRPLDFEEVPTDIPTEIRDPEDSGVVSMEIVLEAKLDRDSIVAARQAVIAEHQRIQGADHYAVLLIDRNSTKDDIEAAYQVKLALLQRKTQAIADAGDRAKLDTIITAYKLARTTLLDPARRVAYNRELAGGELVQEPPAIDTELNFRIAEEMMAKQQWTQAIGLLRTVIARSPNEADYHAALGWATWNAGEHRAERADEARTHLNLALSINPDHPAAHDYKGRIDATLRVDEAGAVFHLERALDADPTRGEALVTLENLLISRGELRRLERILKRLLFRLRGKPHTVEANVWLRLARLYLDHLDDPAGAASAIANARKIAPSHPEVIALGNRSDDHRRNTLEPPRAGWREALGDASTGAALVNTTAAAGHADAAFLAASTMVALGTADDAMGALYDLHRVRAVALPPAPLGREHWTQLRHKDDAVELGALFELLAPAVHALAPMTLADSDLDAGQRVADRELPAAFARLRTRIGALLGVGSSAPIYARTELGFQIHVVACNPPVLAAGDEALTAPERADLVFRLARAMTFLWPGRAVGASRPGRVLKAIVLAIVREAAATDVGADEPLANPATEALAELSVQARAQARASALRLLSRSGGGLNLSLWARSLSRTADRAGMLLCGDVPAAFSGAKEMGDLEKDLVEFAYSTTHVTLRRQLGLSRG
jgi:tetratricopeptide (TPR) repeat protein